MRTKSRKSEWIRYRGSEIRKESGEQWGRIIMNNAASEGRERGGKRVGGKWNNKNSRNCVLKGMRD